MVMPARCYLTNIVYIYGRTKMEEAIRKMQDRLFNKGRKYNELIQVI